MSSDDIFHKIIEMAASPQPRIQIFSIDHRRGNERTEIIDLYWFEENGIHSFDDPQGWTGSYTFEIFVGGVMVWPILTGDESPT